MRKLIFFDIVKHSELAVALCYCQRNK